MRDRIETEYNPGLSVRINKYDYDPVKFKAAVAFTGMPYMPIGFINDAINKRYNQKSEDKMHVTLLPDELFDRLGKEVSGRLSSELQAFCEQNPTIQLSDEIYEINKDKEVTVDGKMAKYERQSLLVSLDPESAFVQEVNEIYSRYIPKEDIPFLHITLFTRPNNKYADEGIGIASQKEWEEMQKRPYGRLRQSA